MRQKPQLSPAEIEALEDLGWRLDARRRPGPMPLHHIMPIDDELVEMGVAEELPVV